MADRDVAVRVTGGKELRRALKLVSPVFDKELAGEIRATGEKIAAEARAEAPRRTGAYAASIRTYAARGGVAVGSRLPQAGVLHWGGTIRPRGVPIVFKRRAVVYEAAQRHMDRTVDEIGDAFDRAARKAGWH